MFKSIPAKYALPLVGLTISTFVFNTSEFMPIGLLMDISRSFAMTESQTGIMITAYAWVVAVLSLPLMLLVCNLPPRRLLLGTLALFAAGQILSGLSVTFPMLMASRIVVACAHAIFWSIVAPLATRLVTRQHRPMALSMVVIGSSVAMIFGLPLGRVVGLYAGWRITFLLIGFVTLALIGYQFFAFPRLSRSEPFTLHDLPQLLRQPVVLSVYFLAVLFPTAYFTAYSYIEPFLKLVAGFSDTSITTTLMLLGVSGLGGSFFFSHFYNNYRKAVLLVSLVFLVGALFLWQTASSVAAIMVVVALVLGMANALFSAAFQTELIRAVPISAASVAMSIYSGISNVGIGSGTWIGGKVMEHDLLPSIGYVGGCIGLVAFVFCVLVYFRLLKKVEEN